MKPSIALVVLLGESTEEVLREDEHVAPRDAQRRHLDVHDVEAVVEVLAEAALADVGREVAVGRGDEPHVDGDRSRCRRRARTSAPAGRASSFTCVASGISPISSRNSVPPWACSKRPMRRLSAPVNAPFSWPKSSLSSSDSASAAQCSATNGTFGARALAGGWRGELALAGAALAGDEHRRACGGDLPRDAVDLLHRRARADEPLQALAVALAKLPAQVLGLDAEVAALDARARWTRASASKSIGLVR